MSDRFSPPPPMARGPEGGRINVWRGIYGHQIVGPVFYNGTLNPERFLDLILNGAVATFVDNMPLISYRQVMVQHDGPVLHHTLPAVVVNGWIRYFLVAGLDEEDRFPGQHIHRIWPHLTSSFGALLRPWYTKLPQPYYLTCKTELEWHALKFKIKHFQVCDSPL
jgi:hypothetical protein